MTEEEFLRIRDYRLIIIVIAIVMMTDFLTEPVQLLFYLFYVHLYPPITPFLEAHISASAFSGQYLGN